MGDGKLTRRAQHTENGHKHSTAMRAVASGDCQDDTNLKNSSSTWWKRSLNAAIKGGASGSIAMILQVFLLMWLRTTVNYQYKYGVDSSTAFSRLYREGGILRFYRGASVALLTGPIARFGDTASNEGIRELLGGSQGSKPKLPVWAMTLTASIIAALWRVTITPLDTIKTTLQVGSEHGWKTLMAKIHNNSFLVLWDGALGNCLATLAGHYPWFLVHNFLDARLPKPKVPSSNAPPSEHKKYRRLTLLRRALIGFCSSFASDCVSNGIRVAKTYQQTSAVPISYATALSELLAANGIAFAVRGLRLKLLSNGLSGILFSVLWKMIQDHLNSSSSNSNSSTSPKGGSKSV